jgi:archaellum component FlaC
MQIAVVDLKKSSGELKSELEGLEAEEQKARARVEAASANLSAFHSLQEEVAKKKYAYNLALNREARAKAGASA